jgi:hypothetical protein
MRNPGLWLASIALATLPFACRAESREPRAGCLDARAVQKLRHFDPDTLLVGSPGGGFVLNLAAGCGASLRGPQTLLAQDGWVCGGEREFVRAGETHCPIIGLTPLPAREYARLAMSLDRTRPPQVNGDEVVLETLEVTAPAEQPALRFRGDPDYCFTPGALRGWRVDGNDLVVQTAPRHAGGNRSYRVELAHGCPDLAWQDEIAFRSGIGLGLICGNPGDKVLGLGTSAGRHLQRGSVETPGDSRAGCEIAAVYPGE